MTVKSDRETSLARLIAEAWPGTTLTAEPTPLAGGFWAAMYRLRVGGQPSGVPAELVFRVAPDAAMGSKELAVQRTVAELGFSTPAVRLSGPFDAELGGSWSVMDFATGASPLGDLNGLAAVRRAPALFARLPGQLAGSMAQLHALDPEPVSSAVIAAAPTVAWRVEDLNEHFETAAEVLGRSDLARAIRQLADRRPPEGTTVICHGDLHPFNLLVDRGDVTVVDWTGALRAEPAYDVAFTTMLLANPPLAAPRPLAAIIRGAGRLLAHRFVTRYRSIAQQQHLGSLEWYRALHGARVLVTVASDEARHGPSAGGNPLAALLPAATAALGAVTDAPINVRG